jgi:hypothetical protein
MPFYLRKSLRVGPLRFNLSKSGIGVSAGIPGFRVGMGPRGNYVHAGRNGFYYRSTLPSGGPRQRRIAPSTLPEAALTNGTLGPEQEIESGSVDAMVDETSAGLLAELQAKRRQWRVAPVTAIVAVLALLSAWPRLPGVGQALAVVLAVVIVVLAHQYDLLRKSTVLMYDMDADAQHAFEALISALQNLGRSQRLWHIGSSAQVLDRKYHAGASASIKRHPTTVRLGSAPLVKCNVEIPTLAVGRQTLCFFPDRLVVFDRGSVGAIGYAELSIDRHTTRFIEEEGVPSDSRVVDRTWRYVNKKGGPDRRFKNNRELPICEYEALHLRSSSGLNELLHASYVGAGEALERLLASRGPHTPAAFSPRAV